MNKDRNSRPQGDMHARTEQRKHPMKILVVDDHAGFREEMKQILEAHGHHADIIGSASAAIPLVENENYDLVLMDYQMPKHNGVWFMKNVSLPRKTRVLLITAYTNPLIIHGMFDHGVSGYIIKPFTEQELLRHVNFHGTNMQTEHRRNNAQCSPGRDHDARRVPRGNAAMSS